MNKAIPIVTAIFIFFTVLLIGAASITYYGFDLTYGSLALGIASVISILLLAAGRVVAAVELRAFNTLTLGLIFGLALGHAGWLIIEAAAGTVLLEAPFAAAVLRIATYLTTAFMATVLTFLNANRLQLSIPFVSFETDQTPGMGIVVDESALSDPRFVDLATSGLIDRQLVVSRFLLSGLQKQLEGPDDCSRGRIRRAVEAVKRLEGVTSVGLRYSDEDFPEVNDAVDKLVRLARHRGYHLLTADISRVQQAGIEGVKIINLHTLANLLKPITQTGETISIKIQRYGKEPMQGVGYLDDGTMVVVNGGGDYIGDTIEAQVLSVKHTASGRMIFCNAVEQRSSERHRDESSAGKDTERDYFLV